MVSKSSNKRARRTSKQKNTSKNTFSQLELSQLTPKLRWNPFALGYTFAIFGAAWVLIISLAGKMGYMQSQITMMQQYHNIYSLSFFGIIGSMAYAAICGLIFGFLIAWLYNKFVD
jgi:hypothetical protein